MPKKNQTTVTEFILLGLSSNPHMQIFLFSVFLVIYLITLGGNIVIMVVIRAESHLNTPMYFFLFHLSFIDICYSSVTVPNTLKNFLAVHRIISVHDCIVQKFFILLSGGAEILILSAMAYDLYAAICDPLRYMERMSKGICVQLVSAAWAISFFHALLNTVFTFKLHFCGPNQISHFICELPPLLQLSCTVTLTNQVVLLTSAVILGSSSFLLTLISYIHIISTILRICSAEGRCKAFSTCSSHLIVVFSSTQNPAWSPLSCWMKCSPFQHRVLTSILNPIIYSLKNKEVKTAVGKMLRKLKFLK